MNLMTAWKRRQLPTDAEADGPVKAADSHKAFVWSFEPHSEADDGRFALVNATVTDDPYAAIHSAIESASAAASIDSTADREKRSQPLSDNGTASTSRTSTALTPARKPPNPEIIRLRQKLDAAIDGWQDHGELASPELLKIGLSASESGVRLSPRHCSLLLRSALTYRRGMLTALRCQDDPQRTALIVSEALTVHDNPMQPSAVVELIAEDPNGHLWRLPLLSELHIAATSADGKTKRRAIEALAVLQGLQDAKPPQSAFRQPVRWILPVTALISIVLLGSVFWIYSSANSVPEGPVLPAGTYVIMNGEGATNTVTTGGLRVSAYEVTNREYRLCVDRGECSPPAATHAGHIADYFTAQQYERYPVVHITNAQAEEYCRAQGKRLPTSIEWTLAATAAPATDTAIRYPWGNAFSIQQANTVESLIGSPVEVGSYSTAGDSPIGAADVAGNVAEWTSTTQDEGATYIVKGGSFRDAKEAALASADAAAEPNYVADWIGFRCVSQP